jgi:hypothetical protein
MDRVYSNMSGDESSSSRTAILPWYYLQRPTKCPLELSWWCQITALNTTVLNWSIQTLSRYNVLKGNETLNIFINKVTLQDMY